VCCGWLNRGLAMGEGMLFLGQLDANMVALDIKTGKEVWRTPIEDWHNGYGITNAPLYYDGIIYTGITGGEFGIRGRVTALDAKTGKILWRAYTLPAPGEAGGDTWPAGTEHFGRGGASVWNTPALDPELGLVYFAVGNCGPAVLGGTRADPTLGDRRNQLVADVVQPRNREPLRTGHGPNQRLCSRPQSIFSGGALHERHAGGAD